MGLHRFKPIPSGRMGALWTLASIRGAALIEFGCMGHLLYSSVTLERTGVHDGCKLYSTHIDESDIAFGETKRLDKTVENVVEKDSPKAIFLLPSSIPEVTGVDLKSLCIELREKYKNVKLIPFENGGFDVNQYKGIEGALSMIVKELAKEVEKTEKPTFNIIGSCADMFRFQADANEIIRILNGAFDMEPVCVMTSDTSVEEIENMGSAHINIVVRKEGIKAAKNLRRRLGTPYIIMRPYGLKGTEEFLNSVSENLEIDVNREFVDRELEIARKQLKPIMPSFIHISKSHPEEAILSLGGHIDVVEGILSFGINEMSLQKGVCWCNSPDLATEEIPYFSEKKWVEAIKSHKDGFLMTSGEALEWSGRDTSMQISNPDTKYRIHPYDPPFVGFRGAVNIANIWMNESKEN